MTKKSVKIHKKVHFATKYLKTTKRYGNSDDIFEKFNPFSIGIRLNIMGLYGNIMAKNQVEIYGYFNFLNYELSYMAQLKTISP